MHAATATGPRRQCCAPPVRLFRPLTIPPSRSTSHLTSLSPSFFSFFPSPCLSRCASLSFFLFLCPVLSSCRCCGGQSPSQRPLWPLWRRADSTHGDHAETRSATRNQYDRSGRRAEREGCMATLAASFFSLFSFCPSLPPSFFLAYVCNAWTCSSVNHEASFPLTHTCNHSSSTPTD